MSWYQMPAPTALAMYTEMRDMPYCSENVSMEECDAIVMDDPWHNWNYADLTYARTTAVFLFVGIMVLAVGNATMLLRKRWPEIARDPMYIWIAGIARYATSKQWRAMNLGQAIVIGGAILFFTIMTLAPQPYYWPNPIDFGSSPPLATRTGYMAIAILPFQVILATKWNLITCLTGVSHEKLQVYHRWLGWMMFALSLLHTFPFIVVDIETGSMASKMATDWYTVSGIICLVPLGVLVVGFTGPIRRRVYEISKGVHFILAAFFVVMLFLHCGFTMTSAYYFVALAAAYSCSWLVRLFIVLRNGLHRASIHLQDDLVEISIPSRLHWKPGQHFFLRFLTRDMHMLTSHPFTAASIPDDGRIDFLVKRRGGMTKRLGEHTELRVVIDGPYGGVDLEGYDRVLLLAGGSGLSFLLGVARDLLGKSIPVTIVYVSRSINCSRQVLGLGTVFSHLSTASKDEVQPEAILPGRPDLARHIQEATRSIGTVGIAACGPEGFLQDVRTTVAAEQLRIVAGETDCTECYLHTEVFGW